MQSGALWESARSNSWSRWMSQNGLASRLQVVATQQQEDDMTGMTRVPAAEINGFKGALIKRFAK